MEAWGVVNEYQTHVLDCLLRVDFPVAHQRICHVLILEWPLRGPSYFKFLRKVSHLSPGPNNYIFSVENFSLRVGFTSKISL